MTNHPTPTLEELFARATKEGDFEWLRNDAFQGWYGGLAQPRIDRLTALVNSVPAILKERKELMAALQRIVEITGDRASVGFNEAGRLSQVHAIARTLLTEQPEKDGM